MFYADAVVAVRVEERIAAAAKAPQIASHLLVQPDVLEARAVVDAIDHLGHPLHPWLVADRRARVEEDRPDVVLDQLSFDIPYQTPFLRVGLYRLPVDQRIDFLVAVSAIVARGAAGIVLIEILIRVVEPVLADHHPDGEVLAQHLRKPVGRTKKPRVLRLN